MYVPATAWRQISLRLVQQMSRSVGVFYLQRFEAMRLLLEHRVAHPWLLHAVGEFLDDPAVQIINDPMGVLELSRAPESAAVILDTFLTAKSLEVSLAAADAVAIKIEEDCYTDAQMVEIEKVISTQLGKPGASAAGFEDLVMALPERTQDKLLRQSRGSPGTSSWRRPLRTANASAPTPPSESPSGSPTLCVRASPLPTCMTRTR